MKRWKILVAIAIVGVLVIPVATIPVAKADGQPYIPPVENEGDIILADGGHMQGVPDWDHAQIYIGDGNVNVPVPAKWGSKSCIESDPHVEAWPGPFKNWRPPSSYSKWKLRTQLEPKGGVEWTDLTQTYNEYKEALDEGHVAMACYKLVGFSSGTLQDIRENAMPYAYGKLKDQDDDGVEENPEHMFDLISYWRDDAKQWQGTDERAQRYYCSELVWAAYRWGGYKENYYIDLDDDGGEVSPRDLIQTSLTDNEWQIGSPEY